MVAATSLKKPSLWTLTGQIAVWVVKVFRQMFRSARWITVRLIVYSILAMIARILSLLMPIKVVILAASDGVPRYFRFFIQPDQKDQWIGILAAIAVVAYVFKLLLDARTTRLAERGSARFLATASAINVVRNQKGTAMAYYAQFTGIFTSLIFSVLVVVLLAIFNPLFSIIYTTMVLAFFTFSSAMARRYSLASPAKIPKFIVEKNGEYLEILSGVLFLSSFLVILYPFLVALANPGAPEPNAVAAMVAILLVRRTNGALGGLVGDFISFHHQRPVVDTLVFADRQLQRAEGPHQRTIRDLFGKADRTRKMADELTSVLGHRPSVDVQWMDPAARGINLFGITVPDRGGDRYYWCDVYAQNLAQLLDNEDLLFKHISRTELLAPAYLKRFVYGPFVCQIVASPASTPIPDPAWRDGYFDCLVHLWSRTPPQALLDIYRSAHQMLYQRFNEKLLMRMEVAIDTPREAEILRRLMERVPAIQAKLEPLPFAIGNGAFGPKNVTVGPDGNWQIMNWSRWSLDQMGTAGPNLPPPEMARLLDMVRDLRRDIPASLTVADLTLARSCSVLERVINQGSHKTALAVVARDILEMPADEVVIEELQSADQGFADAAIGEPAARSAMEPH